MFSRFASRAAKAACFGRIGRDPQFVRASLEVSVSGVLREHGSYQERQPLYEAAALPLRFERRRPAIPKPTATVDCRSLGSMVLHAWLAGATPAFPLLSSRELLAVAAVKHDPSIVEAVALVASHVNALGDLSDQSSQRLFTEVARFAQRLEVMRIERLADVGQRHAEDFVHEAIPQGDGWTAPATATTHVRRSAVRMLFRAARQLHLATHDPTLDLVLPSRTALRTRPLTDDEELLGRIFSRHTLTATRLPAAWALGQATAVSSEIAAAVVRDVDLAGSRVWLHGCRKREARWGELTNWGVEQLGRRIDDLDEEPDAPLVSAGRSPVSGQAASCGAIHTVLTHAGFSREPDVRPGSLAGWAGARLLMQTGRIETVAVALGARSLDQAARIIGWDWT